MVSNRVQLPSSLYGVHASACGFIVLPDAKARRWQRMTTATPSGFVYGYERHDSSSLTTDIGEGTLQIARPHAVWRNGERGRRRHRIPD